MLASFMLKWKKRFVFRIMMGLLPKEPWEDLEEAIQHLQPD